jgi:O-succinylbenzoate synthase
MIIESIRSIRVPVSFVDPLRTSQGTHRDRLASILEITTEDGIVGWGEDVSPQGVVYVGESPTDSFTSLGLLADLVSRRTIDVSEMFSDTWWGVDGHNFAKHAIESALWDVHAQTLGTSLKRALGGTQSTITPGVVVGVMNSMDELETSVRARSAEGYKRIKLKIQPGWDVDIVRHVRKVVGDEFVLHVDANGAYSRDDISLLCQLEEFNVQLIEQPFPAEDLASHASLVASTRIPICLDESIMNAADLMEAIENRACNVVNIKPSRLGGVCDAIRLQEIATAHGLEAWVGGMLETGIGRASCLALASRPGFTLTPDLSASSRYFARDITEPFVLTDGTIAVPDSVGIGVFPLPWVFEHPDVKIETLFRV